MLFWRWFHIYADCYPIRRPRHYEVVAPDMVLVFKTLSLTHEPSFSHNCLRFGCFFGALRPSLFHILSTLLWFTLQPSWFNNTVILRYPYRAYRAANALSHARSAFKQSSPSKKGQCCHYQSSIRFFPVNPERRRQCQYKKLFSGQR